MRRALSTKYRLAGLVMSIFLALSIAGCEGDDGVAGTDGTGGIDGADGLACWDLNANGAADPAKDVHMGTDGGNFECVACNNVKQNANENVVDHGIGGMPCHSVDEGVMETCEGCHGDAASRHAGLTVEPIIASHPQLACQVCHIPTFARKDPTKTAWFRATAGDMERVPVIDPETGKPDYDKMNGDFEWARNVRPVLRSKR